MILRNKSGQGVFIIFFVLALLTVGFLIYGGLVYTGKIDTNRDVPLIDQNASYNIILSAKYDDSIVDANYILYADGSEVSSGLIHAGRVEVYPFAKFNKTYLLRAFHENYYFGSKECHYVPRDFYKVTKQEATDELELLNREAGELEHKMSKTEETSDKYVKMSASLNGYYARINETLRYIDSLHRVENDNSGLCGVSLVRKATVSLVVNDDTVRILVSDGVMKMPLLCVGWRGDIIDIDVLGHPLVEEPERLRHEVDECYSLGKELSSKLYLDVSVVGGPGEATFYLIDMGVDENYELTYEVDNNIRDLTETFIY